MNVKFLLFCIASLGCLMMFYMWFTVSSTIRESQNNDEQYLYRISSLKSEIDVEKKLMETLRKEVKERSNSIGEKTNLIDRMNKKGINFDKDRAKFEKEIEDISSDQKKLTHSKEAEKQKIENEYAVKSKEEDSQIDNLESEIKKLSNERKELQAKQSKTVNLKDTKIPANDKIVDNTMQGKAPKIKESNVGMIPSDTKIISKQNDPKDQMTITQKKETKVVNKMKSDTEPKISQIDQRDMDTRGDSQEKPKLNQAKDNSQLFPPDLNKKIQKDKDNQQEKLNKEDVHADHQLKPPKSEKDPKDDFIKAGMSLKNNMKKEVVNDNERGDI